MVLDNEELERQLELLARQFLHWPNNPKEWAHDYLSLLKSHREKSPPMPRSPSGDEGENKAKLWCPKCKADQEMKYDGNWECLNCGYQFGGNPPSMIKKPERETRQIVFLIPNKFCEHYGEPHQCLYDKDDYHTCCKEECPLTEVQLLEMTFKERHIELSKKEEKSDGNVQN